ncbi:hypothetical protein [Cupriavidus metallidurans]|uniref:hypothetical protein n=1 Tax=Cupriavidus metallidurans TaxID=119219 RepID=UPI000AABFED9|nr:hypothetical protein [Cupriavidus metallidurans]
MPKLLKIAAETGTDSDDAERIALTERVRAAESEIERLNAEAQRCTATIAAADTAHQVVEDLRRARAQLLADAVVAGSPAILTGVDGELAAAVQAREQADQDADDAGVMQQVVTARIDAVKADLASHRADLTRLAREELGRLRAEAEREYESLCEQMAAPVGRLYAIDLVLASLAGNPGGVRDYLGEQLREKGLRVRQHGFSGDWVRPIWLTRSDPYGPAYQDLKAMLESWGLKP